MDAKKQNQKIKTAPKPEYSLCNQGHQLVPVYSHRFNIYVWDCPTCIEAQKKAYAEGPERCPETGETTCDPNCTSYGVGKCPHKEEA